MYEIDADVIEIADLYIEHCRMTERDALAAAFRTWQLLVAPTPADLARRGARLRLVELQ